jgi:hypothetical protein
VAHKAFGDTHRLKDIIQVAMRSWPRRASVRSRRSRAR